MQPGVKNESPTFKFYDSILKNITIEMLVRLIKLRDFVRKYVKESKAKSHFSDVRQNGTGTGSHHFIRGEPEALHPKN